MITNPFAPLPPQRIPLFGPPPPPAPAVMPGCDLINDMFDEVAVLNENADPVPSPLLNLTALPPSPYFRMVTYSVDDRCA